METIVYSSQEALDKEAKEMALNRLAACNIAIAAMNEAGYTHKHHVYTMMIGEQLKLMNLLFKAQRQRIKPEDI